jgi:hypothetical protein
MKDWLGGELHTKLLKAIFKTKLLAFRRVDAALRRHGVDESNANMVTRFFSGWIDDQVSGTYAMNGTPLIRVCKQCSMDGEFLIIQDLVDAPDQQQEKESTG